MEAVVSSPVVAIDGLKLGDMLRAGIYRLFQRTDYINKINVFPVPDGDTGTNMSMTLGAVLAALDRERLEHAGSLLVRAADAAIDGARGNSGAILSQFFLGLADRASGLARLSTRDFVAGVVQGSTYARDALTQPREGTILTVLRAFGAELEKLLERDPGAGLAELVRDALRATREALARTPEQLDVLREAKVVDAGAQGFVDMLEGMTDYLQTGRLEAVAAPVHDQPDVMSAGGLDTEQRYCTECLIVGEAIDLRALRETLSAQGASLVVGGSQRKAKIHIHTNEPERVFETAARFGTVSGQKADDMIRQQAAAHHARGRRVAVVVDSAADIPEGLAEELELHVVPLRVHFGARSYLDKVTLSADEFYRELRSNPDHPKTSQPPPGDFRRMYEFLASHYESVVSITVSARVSGTWNAAHTAAQRMPGGKVTVIDSTNASLGQGLVALRAAQVARDGGDLERVVAAVRAAIPRTRTFALLARLDYAVRGGRVPKVFKTIADFLGFSPVLTNMPDGQVKPGGLIFGRRNARARFARFVAKRMPPGRRYRLLVGHGDAPEEGAKLLAEILALVPTVESSHLTTLGTALGAHGGPGLLVVGIEELEPASGS